jgi:hypothetical protein
MVWRPADGYAAGVLLRPAQQSERHGLVVFQADGRREVRDPCGPGACRPMYGDMAGNGPGLAGERVHGGCAGQARLSGLLGPARASPGGVGGCLWSSPRRAPRHLVSRSPRPPWRLALTAGVGPEWHLLKPYLFRPEQEETEETEIYQARNAGGLSTHHITNCWGDDQRTEADRRPGAQASVVSVASCSPKQMTPS